MSGHYTDIATFSRRYFDFANLEGNVIDIEDIAQGLSNVCRFGGQCPRFYSVAQHSVLVFRLMRDVLGVTDSAVLMQGLLHDATEAFLGDMVSPLKRMMPDYQTMERQLHFLIMREWDLPQELHQAVKKADLMALAIEKRELWGNTDEWVVLRGVEETPWTLLPYGAPLARAAFMGEYGYLKSKLKTAL